MSAVKLTAKQDLVARAIRACTLDPELLASKYYQPDRISIRVLHRKYGISARTLGAVLSKLEKLDCIYQTVDAHHVVHIEPLPKLKEYWATMPAEAPVPVKKDLFTLPEEPKLSPERTIEGPNKQIVCCERVVAYIENENKKVIEAGKYVSNLDAAQMLCSLFLADKPYEESWVFALDSQLNVLGASKVSTGTVNSTYVYPRNVFSFLFQMNATACILAHNHPCGTLKASREDIALTTKFLKLANELGIRILDHLIVGEKDEFLVSETPTNHYSENNQQPERKKNMAERTQILNRERRRFACRLSDDQTLFMEYLDKISREKVGTCLDCGAFVDGLLEMYPPFILFQENRELALLAESTERRFRQEGGSRG